MQDNVFVTLVVSVQYQVSKLGLEAVTLLAFGSFALDGCHVSNGPSATATR